MFNSDACPFAWQDTSLCSASPTRLPLNLPLFVGLWRGSLVGLYAVRARCVYWGCFVDLPTYSAVKCICFQAVKDITIVHCTVSPYSFTHVSFTASCGHRCQIHLIKW